MSPSTASKRPSRASHVGSLLRPRYLFEKRKALEAGECLPEDLRPFEDEAIKQVLKLQQDVGIKTVTDGEMRRLVSLFGTLCSPGHKVNISFAMLPGNSSLKGCSTS